MSKTEDGTEYFDSILDAIRNTRVKLKNLSKQTDSLSILTSFGNPLTPQQELMFFSSNSSKDFQTSRIKEKEDKIVQFPVIRSRFKYLNSIDQISTLSQGMRNTISLPHHRVVCLEEE